MDIEYLKTVLAVADCRSFYKAAKMIPCSQSSVSRQIAKVEKDLGAAIFKHAKGGKVELTPFGNEVIHQIKQIDDCYNSMRESANRVLEEGVRVIKMGILRGPFNSSVKGNLISDLYLRHPNFSIVLQDYSYNDTIANVAAGNLDCALVYKTIDANDPIPSDYGTDLNEIRLFRKTPCIAMAKDHHFTNFETVNFKSLRYETFALSAVSSTLIQNDYFYKSCQQGGFTPKVKSLPLGSYAETRDAAVAANGWMYPTFQTKVMSHAERVTLVPVENPIYYATFFFVYGDLDKDIANELASSVSDFLSKDDNSCLRL